MDTMNTTTTFTEREHAMIENANFAKGVSLAERTRRYIETTIVREEEPRNPEVEASLREEMTTIIDERLTRAEDIATTTPTCARLYKNHEERVLEWLTQEVITEQKFIAGIANALEAQEMRTHHLAGYLCELSNIQNAFRVNQVLRESAIEDELLLTIDEQRGQSLYAKEQV